MKKDLILELDRLLKSSDKKQVEDFLVANFDDLPEELKKLVVFTFVAEATQDRLKQVVGDYIMQTAVLQGLGEALGEIEKTNNK